MSITPQNFDQKLQWLDSFTLNDLADFFDFQAENCRQKAAVQAHKDQEKIAAAIDELTRMPRIIMRFLKQGCTLEEAKEKTAVFSNAPLGSVEQSWKRFCSEKSLYELKRRNRLIIELATFGFSNSDIGKKVSLHPNSVARIISSARRDYHTARNKKIDPKIILNGGVRRLGSI